MHHLSTRQQVLSENIANSDTPGYRTKDVEAFSDYVSGARSTGLSSTHARHIGSIRGGDVQVVKPTSWGESPNGNNVILEEETIKAADTADNYQFATRLYTKAYGLLKAATTMRG
ncbi:Flagellar basal-body rod protein FlgB [Salipiger mucosus DSM 16094]|uniref:Flagellar basal body rod protein FlgB n=2 Tax=Salipiger mucosus TaxID=263378 RepID=S9QDK2_9RHOB|nr:Flagellar basal-body rod protein FlgB [Salipiger mucosus DSM 16094]